MCVYVCVGGCACACIRTETCFYDRLSVLSYIIILDNQQWPLQAHPQWGGMFGGHEVTLSGPCFFNTALMKCRFHDVVTDVAPIRHNMMKSVCKQPILNSVGPITLSVSVDGGLSFKYHVTYNVGK